MAHSDGQIAILTSTTTQGLSIWTALGASTLDQIPTGQANLIVCADDVAAMMRVSLACFPLIPMPKPPSGRVASTAVTAHMD